MLNRILVVKADLSSVKEDIKSLKEERVLPPLIYIEATVKGYTDHTCS